MDEATKAAYRRILYAAMLDFRAHQPISYADHYAWLKPWKWRKTARRLVEIQKTADWLHNLADFSSRDFEGFDETMFWRDYDAVIGAVGRFTFYKALFENDQDDTGQSKLARAWGQPIRDG